MANFAGYYIEMEPLAGNEEFISEMGELSVRVEAIEPLYTLLYEAFLDIERERFQREGPGWAPLLPSTVTRRGGESHPILVRSGALKESLTKAGAHDAVFELMPDGFVAGTDNPSAEWHQAGTKHMVARPPVAEGEEYAMAMGKISEDYLFGVGGVKTIAFGI